MILGKRWFAEYPKARAYLEGAGLVVDMQPRSYNRHLFMASDVDAMRSDWMAVGDDIRVAMKKAKQIVESTRR